MPVYARAAGGDGVVCGAWVCAGACGEGMKIGIIAALPGELKPLVRGWERVPQTRRDVQVWRQTDTGGDTVVAVSAGMGAEAARTGVCGGGEWMARSTWCFRWAGLERRCGAEAGGGGGALGGDRCADGRAVYADGGEGVVCVVDDVPVIADEREKQRLWATYGAVMVDMESATVARMAQQRGIPMCCIKAVSDEAEAVLPDCECRLSTRTGSCGWWRSWRAWRFDRVRGVRCCSLGGTAKRRRGSWLKR